MKIAEKVNDCIDRVGQALTERNQACCGHKQEPTALKVAKKITAVAIGVLAAMAAPLYFSPAFALGFAYGSFLTFRGFDITASIGKISACAQQFLEDLTGIKLPIEVAFAFNAAIFIHHLVECGSIFGVMAGFTLGSYAGREFTILFTDEIATIASA